MLKSPRFGLAVTCCTLLLAGCQTISSEFSAAANWGPTFLGPYRPDVHQGNIITQEMVDKLKPGMTRRQVAFVMGEPVVRDPFNPDRWDYVYSVQVGNGLPLLQPSNLDVMQLAPAVGQHERREPGGQRIRHFERVVACHDPNHGRRTRRCRGRRGRFGFGARERSPEEQRRAGQIRAIHGRISP
jgi:outer membrane protein assembly factor BamE (lipoprotein component of BamABCDE complex)